MAFAKIIVLSLSFSLDHLSNPKYSIFSIILPFFIRKSLFFLFAITSKGNPQTPQNGSQTLAQDLRFSTFAISTIFHITFLGVKNCPIHFTPLSLFKNVSYNLVLKAFSTFVKSQKSSYLMRDLTNKDANSKTGSLFSFTNIVQFIIVVQSSISAGKSTVLISGLIIFA